MRSREESGEYCQRHNCQLACAAFPALAFLGGIGSGELAVVMVIVLLIFGPKQLPEMARSMAKALRGIRRATDEIKEEIGLDQILEGGKIDKRDFDLSKPYEPKHSPPALPPPHLTEVEEEPGEEAKESEVEEEPDREDEAEARDEGAERQAAEEAYGDAVAADEEPEEAPAEAPEETADDPDRRDS